MKFTRFCCSWLIVIFSAALMTSPMQADDRETQEPPQLFELKIGDQSITIQEGTPVDVNGTFSNPQVTLVPKPTRLFVCRGVQFEYPRQFNFEADLEDQLSHIWTLSGNDLTIMYFVVNGPLTPKQLASNMIETFGKENCEFTDLQAKLQLGQENVSGVKFTAKVAEHPLLIDIYALPQVKGKSRLLMLQGSLDANGDRNEEGRAGMELLQKSFKIVP